MTRSTLRPLILGLLVLGALPAKADAAYDMSGKWLVASSSPPARRLDLAQASGTLTSNPGVGILPWQGSVDEGTGEFHLTIDAYPCDPLTFDGFVAADGRTLSGTMTLVSFDAIDGCVTAAPEAVSGSRCGNTVVDPWETCDDGNGDDGDCCSSACALDAPGAACNDDGTVCTTEACDGAGACQHVPAAGPCSETHGCGQGQCSAGACTITSPAAAGTSCDLDASVCTPDTCDGAGHCDAAAPIDCSPCGTCDDADGCVRPSAWTCDESPDLVKLVVRTSASGRGDRLRVSFDDASLAGSVGDPTNDTRYRVCLYADDGGVERPVYGAVLAPKAQCDGHDCWAPARASDSWIYKDAGASTGGVSSFEATQWSGFALRAKGTGLALPFPLPPATTMIPVVRAVEDSNYYGARCWSHAVTGLRPAGRVFRAQYPPKP